MSHSPDFHARTCRATVEQIWVKSRRDAWLPYDIKQRHHQTTAQHEFRLCPKCSVQSNMHTHITRTYVCEYKLKHKSYVQSNAFAHESAKIRPHHCPTPCLSKSGQFGNCIITQRKAAGIIACLRLKIQALKHIIRNLNPLNMMFFWRML